MVDKDLDIRDQYTGLTYLRQAFVPIPLGMKDSTKKRVPFADRADASAEFLHTKKLGKTEQTPTPSEHSRSSNIITEELGIPTADITMEEIV